MPLIFRKDVFNAPINPLCFLTFLILLLLSACNRSPDTTLYLLNSIPLKQQIKQKAKTLHAPAYSNLRLGIERITIPSYLTKSAMMLHETPYRLRNLDNYQWGDSLEKMIHQVITANLQTLLPGAVIEDYPWSAHLHPNYYLQVTITDFKMMFDGKTLLRAYALVHTDKKPVRAINVSYESRAPAILLKKPLQIEALVKAMNQHLTRLTQEVSVMLRNLDFSEHDSVEPHKSIFKHR